MNRYKLLTWYPSLPSDWEVGMEVGIGDGKDGFSPCSSIYTEKYISIYEVTKYPYFWGKNADTTFDGVELDRGDNFFVVNQHTLSLSDENAHIYDSTCNFERAKLHGFIWFSTKKAALHYIADNSKTFTRKDMMDFGAYLLKEVCANTNLSNAFDRYIDSACNKTNK